MPAVKYLFLMALFVAATPIRAGDPDIGDQFREYVNKVLPQGHELAKQSAKLIERTVIQNGVSLAQSHLDQASRDIVELNAQLVKLEAPDFFNADITDPWKLLSQISVLSQMINFVNRIQARVDRFDQILNGLGPHCDAPDAFAHYNIDTLNLSYTVPNFNFFTGVKVGFVLSTDYGIRPKTMNEGGDEDDIPFVGPIIRMFKNRAIRNSIEEQADRIRREQCTTETYKSYAFQACRSLSLEAAKEMQPYRDLAASIRKFAADIPLDKLADLKAYLRDAVAQFEKGQIEFLTEQAKEGAARWMKPKEEALFQARLGIQTNERLNLNLARLEKAECGKGILLIEEVLADISLTETYELKSSARLLPGVKGRLERRKSRCPEEAL